MNFTLKGYEVLEMIGEGSFSKVYKVENKQLGTYHAAKKMIDKCESLDDSVFHSEVKLIKTIPSHPNLINIVDLVHENNCLTIIMDLMDMSLNDLITTRKRPLSELHARDILFQIVRGLNHLHSNGVFHRDIKPENILVKRKRRLYEKEIIRLADFGTMSRIDYSQPLTPYIATRWYRAPECLLTMGYYGPKMDIWAVGCCFYEMVTGEALFQGRNEEHMVELIHDLLGTPSQSKLEKFRNLKPEKLYFRKRPAQDFNRLLPKFTAYGIDVLRKTIVYLPNQRISASKLLNHVYFEDLTYRTFSQSSQNLKVMMDCIGSLKNLRLAEKVKLRTRGTSICSIESSCTGNTFHCLSLQDETKKKRTLERLWDMKDSPEKKQLSRQIRRISRLPNITKRKKE